MMPCSFVYWYQRFGRACYLHIQSSPILIEQLRFFEYHEDGGSRHLRILGICIHNYTALCPGRQEFSSVSL
jgi:hypothetical protein